MASRRKPIPAVSRCASLLALIASLGVGLLALEAALRIWDGVPLLSGENFVARRLDIVRANSGPLVHDALLGWKLTANYGSGGGFMTGDLGIRMNSDRLRPPARNAILAVGDSFTAGSEVVNAESFPAHLERLLGIPVLNAASGAWGVDQMVLRAEQLVPILHPTTLIVGILDQDIDRNNFRVFGGGYKPYFVVENGELALQGTPVPVFEESPNSLGFWGTLLGHSYLMDWITQRTGLLPWIHDGLRFEQVQDDGPRISALLMRRLSDLERSRGIRVLVVFLYSGENVTGFHVAPDWVMPTIEAARQGNLEVVDMFPILRRIYEADPEGLKQYYIMHDSNTTYSHMSSEGNLLVARTIASALAKAP